MTLRLGRWLKVIGCAPLVFGLRLGFEVRVKAEGDWQSSFGLGLRLGFEVEGLGLK